MSEIDENKLKLQKLRLNALRSQFKVDSALTTVDQPQAYQRNIAQFGKEEVIDPLLKNVVAPVGRFVDRFAGAPTRAFTNELINDENQGQLLNFPIARGVREAGKTLINGPQSAPTGKQMFSKAGLSDKPMSGRFPRAFSKTGDEPYTFKKGGFFDVSPAGFTGLLGDAVLDFSNVIPIGMASKLAAKLGAKTTGTVLKAGGKGIDVATGTNIAQKTGAGIGEFGKTLAAGAKSRFSGKTAYDYPDYLDTATRNKIDPNTLPKSVKHGKESSISMNEKNIGEGPEGQLIRENNKKVHEQINGALAEDVNKISKGQIYQPEDIGSIMRDGWDNGVNKAFDELDVTYNSVMRDNPRLFIEDAAYTKLDSKIRSMGGQMNGLIKRGGNDNVVASAKQIKRRLEAIQRTNGSYRQILKQLRDIGDEAFKTGRHMKTPPDEKLMRDLYNSLRDALVETADYVSPAIGKQLRVNNKIASDLIGDKSILARTMRDKSIGDEKIFKRIIESGDSKQISALRKFLSPDEWDAVKGSYMGTLMKQNISGEINTGTIFNKIRDSGPRINAMFEPGELDNFVDLLYLKDRVGAPLLSKSGTGSSNMFLDFRNSAVRATDAGIAKAIETAKTPVTKATLSKMLAKKAKKPALKGTQLYSIQQRNKQNALIKILSDKENSDRTLKSMQSNKKGTLGQFSTQKSR